MNNESDIEKLWRQLATKFGHNRTWHQLHPQEQHQFVNGVNMIMDVLK